LSADRVIKPDGPDLATRLLAHLDKVEHEAHEAEDWSSSSWERLSSAAVDMNGESPVVFDAAPVAAHVAVHDPATVLRLVRAHREIVETYRKQAEALATMRRATRYAKVPERLPTSDELRATAAVADTLFVVITKLARGYGLQEDQT